MKEHIFAQDNHVCSNEPARHSNVEVLLENSNVNKAPFQQNKATMQSVKLCAFERSNPASKKQHTDAQFFSNVSNQI